MATNDEYDEFGSDDALDELQDTDLYELEREAYLRSTQANPKIAVNVNGVLKLNNVQKIRLQQNGQQESFESDRTVQPLRPHGGRPPSDYGFDDEEVIDLDEQPLAVQQAYQQDAVQRNGFVDQSDSGPGASARYNGTLREDESYVTALEQPSVDVAALQAQLLQFQQENLNLRRAVDETKSTVQSKSGENAILRQKLEKQARDSNQKESTIRQVYEEKIAKQKAETERIKSENAKVITDNRFLQHDLTLEAGKAKQLQKNLKNGSLKEHASPASTPKKHKVLPFRDGFDDDDVVMFSPSKSRSKPSTPSKGANKRKRGVNEQSPMQPLQLPLSEPKPAPSPSQRPADTVVTSDLLQRLTVGEDKLHFVQNLLGYQLMDSEERIFEALTRYSFPSSPKKKLSSIVYDNLSLNSFDKSDTDAANHFCGIMVSLWDQCLAERCYDPLALIIETLQFILDSESIAFARRQIETIVPLAIATSDIVAIPIARASITKDVKLEHTTSTLSGTIDVLACLTLLHTLAQAAAPFPDAIAQFWRHMKFDFVLLMLMKAQPLSQIMLMLELLQTSALESTFGAILSDDEGLERQARREGDTIDRLTLLLFETPKSPFEDDFNPSQILELRIELLTVLSTLILHTHGGKALSLHRHALGRLFKFLHDSINDLYNYTTTQNHKLQIETVNMTIRLIHHLLTEFADSTDIRAKLATVQGGAHIHLIALTRLAFSERLVFEGGLGTEEVDMAHQLLDEYLSPDEGEALLQMFSSGASEG
ncbi:hypothetical protein EJ08DRAFT_643539 [Tothia fuscella]|uniref:DNA repair protein Rad26 n=1 Tax=Tothia fuscella TaxID=1048955 RepID=A0A9P4NED1_9PEZI|nr:hypothetical protein EJ08DRAFT_643539 [Tothia fuscella]